MSLATRLTVCKLRRTAILWPTCLPRKSASHIEVHPSRDVPCAAFDSEHLMPWDLISQVHFLNLVKLPDSRLCANNLTHTPPPALARRPIGQVLNC